MSSTNTNKQPLFVDRPLFDHALVTTQIAGSEANKTFQVQGGQAPALLVDMDASLSEDDNSGGVIDSLRLTRQGEFQIPPEYTINVSTSGTPITLSSGDVVFIEDATPVTGTNSGVGYYTYTGVETLTGVNTALTYSGGTPSGFSLANQFIYSQGIVTAAFYHTRGTTNPIPASGDYEFVFSQTLVSGVNSIDCAENMPELNAPVAQAGNTTGLAETAPLRTRGIYLEKGDRLYVGVFPSKANTSGYAPGLNVIAQGGFF